MEKIERIYYSFPIVIDKVSYYEADEIERIIDENGMWDNTINLILNTCFYDVITKVPNYDMLQYILGSQLKYFLERYASDLGVLNLKERNKKWLDYVEFHFEEMYRHNETQNCKWVLKWVEDKRSSILEEPIKTNNNEFSLDTNFNVDKSLICENWEEYLPQLTDKINFTSYNKEQILNLLNSIKLHLEENHFKSFVCNSFIAFDDSPPKILNLILNCKKSLFKNDIARLYNKLPKGNKIQYAKLLYINFPVFRERSTKNTFNQCIYNLEKGL